MCFQTGADEGVVLAVEGEGQDAEGGKVDMESHVVGCDTKQDWEFDKFQLVFLTIVFLLAVPA